MSHDTLLHRAIRPQVRLLARTPVTPDLLTVLRLLSGLGAGVCFAAGPAFAASGAGLLLVSCLLDRADGELARQTRRFSRFGGRFDLVADCTATAVTFLGLGVGFDAPDWLPLPSVWLGLAAAAGVVTIFSLLNLSLDGAAHKNDRKDIRKKQAEGRPFDPDDSMLLLPPVIALGGATGVLVAAGMVAPTVAVLMGAVRLVSAMRRRRSFVRLAAD